VANGSQSFPPTRDNVELTPGVYAVDPAFSNNHGPASSGYSGDQGQQCWFLAGGVYEWLAGLTNDGDFISNELKPPDEPKDTDNTQTARRQFWNTNSVNCAGQFSPVALNLGLPILAGTWGVEITSTRTDTYGGVNYTRESAPSYCQTVDIAANQILQVQVSNVPGAKAYNVYLAPPSSNGCSGPFGLAGSIPVVGTPTNDRTAGCPDLTGGSCSLGNESKNFNSAILAIGWAPSAGAAPGTFKSLPPDSETAPLGSRQVNQNPDRAAPPGGDRANENQCDTAGAAPVTCPNQITPGAVSFYIPAGGCLTDTNNGDNFIFSGYQYNWIAVYENGVAYPPANYCISNVLDAASNSAYVGLLYTPSAAISLPTRVSFRTEATGGIIADTIDMSGQLPLVVFSSAYAPVPPAAKLVS
jgi:hypothetical protein